MEKSWEREDILVHCWEYRGLANLVICLLDYLDWELDKNRELSGLYNAVVTSWFLGPALGNDPWTFHHELRNTHSQT